MRFLLDTNVLSELRKKKRDRAVVEWFNSVSADDLFLSALVPGEIRIGVEKLARRDPVQAAALERWLGRLLSLYSDRILPVNAAVADAWGRMNVPEPLPVVDGLMAATARTYGLTLVTRNVADLKRTGVALLNPFSH